MDLTLVVKECFTEEETHWVLKDEWESKSGKDTAGKGNCQGQRPEMSPAGFRCCFDSAIMHGRCLAQSMAWNWPLGELQGVL